MKNLIIRQGRIFDPSQNLDKVGDLYLVNGKVEAIESKIDFGFGAEVQEINAKGFLVTPGWIDMHANFCDPGYSHKESLESGADAAAAGGFTSVACLASTKPVNDNPFVTSYIYQKAKQLDIRVYALGSITKGQQGEQLAEIGSMVEAGVVGICDDRHSVMDAYVMRKAMDYSRKFNIPVITHAEDTHLKGKGVMHEGFNSTRFGLRGIPKAAEELIVARDLMLAELTGARLHISHVSTAGSVKLIREAKEKGTSVTAEVTPHHLTLTDEAVGQYDTNTKVAPPLRESHDIQSLCDGIREGTIDALATDHTPHSVEEKEVEYDLAAFGIVGLETAFPLYNRCHLEMNVPLDKLIAAITVNPAQILNLPGGTLKRGAPADVTIVDPNAKHQIKKNHFKSKSRNTPFHGWDVQGKVQFTIVGGKVVYNTKGETK